MEQGESIQPSELDISKNATVVQSGEQEGQTFVNSVGTSETQIEDGKSPAVSATESLDMQGKNVDGVEEVADSVKDAETISGQALDSSISSSELESNKDLSKGSLKEKIDEASTTKDVIKVYLELSGSCSPEETIAAQRLVAEKFLELGDVKNAVRFTVLFEEGKQLLERRHISETDRQTSQDMLEAGNAMRAASLRNEESAQGMLRSSRDNVEASGAMSSSARRIEAFVSDMDQITRRMQNYPQR